MSDEAKKVDVDGGRYLLEFFIKKVDEEGNEVQQVDHISLLTVTTNLPALTTLMRNLYKDASEMVESFWGETTSDLYPEHRGEATK